MSETWQDPYCYPNSRILRNKANIRDDDWLDDFERFKVAQRLQEPIPTGDFDLDHLRAVHRHLFQDVYEWAGEVRTIEISKGSSSFLHHARIETGFQDIHTRLQQQNYLRDLPADAFADQASGIIGDVNYVHPFREGNGRTQMQFLKQLAMHGGHQIDLSQTDQATWYAASIAANTADYAPMEQAIYDMISDNAHQQGFSQDDPTEPPKPKL